MNNALHRVAANERVLVGEIFISDFEEESDVLLCRSHDFLFKHEERLSEESQHRDLLWVSGAITQQV